MQNSDEGDIYKEEMSSECSELKMKSIELPPNSVLSESDSTSKTQTLQFLILTIEVSHLLSAHRFTKNYPWLKASFGTFFSYVAEHSENSVGEFAIWKDLNWPLVLERNADNVSEFVVSVCSKNIIVGRYVLTVDEFSRFPLTKSGYFEILGEVINGSGVVGIIKLLCRRDTDKYTCIPQKYPRLEVPAPNTNFPSAMVEIQIISVAAVDLRPVHMIELNSPQLVFECGEWLGVTDIVRSAGIAARWNNLSWRFTTRNVGISVTARSNSVLIGKVYIPTEEILCGTTEIVKFITNGKEVCGKIKINCFITESKVGVNFIENCVIPLTPNPVRNITIPFTINVEAITLLDVIKAHLFHNNSLIVNVTCASVGFVSDEMKSAGSFAHWINLKWKINVSESAVFRLNVWSRGKVIGSASLNVDQLLHMPTDTCGKTEIFTKLLNNKNEIVGKSMILCNYSCGLSSLESKKVPIQAHLVEMDSLKFPLLLVVKSIQLFDLTSAHNLTKNRPRVKMVCDRKTAVTSIASNSVLIWDKLNWAMRIRMDSAIDCFVNSGDVLIGKVSIDPMRLFSIPVNIDGLIEIKLQLQHRAVSTGKVKLICKLENTENDEWTTTHNIANISTIFDPNVLLMNSDNIDFDIFLHEIDVNDLVAAHSFVSNSPFVSAACGKWTEFTDVLENSGNSGYWTNLQWNFTFKSSTFLRIVVSSRSVQIGSLYLSLSSLINCIGDQKGLKRITANVCNGSKIVGKLKLTFSMVAQPSPICDNMHTLDFNNCKIDKELISCPFNIEIRDISVTDLYIPYANFRPTIKIMCHDLCEETEEISLTGTDIIHWPSLRWNFSVHDIETPIKVFIQTANSTIGCGCIDNISTLGAPEDVSGYRECIFSLYNQVKVAGSMRIVYKLTNITHHQPKLIGNFDTSSADLKKICIVGVSLIDLVPVHRFSNNCPSVSIVCGKSVALLEEQYNSGGQAHWDSLKHIFILEDLSTLRILVSSKGLAIGGCNISKMKLVKMEKPVGQIFVYFDQLTDDDDCACGKLKLSFLKY